MTTPDQFPDAEDMVPTVVAFLDAQGHPRHVKFVPSANDRRHCAPFRPLITQEAHELFVAALMARLEAAERDASERAKAQATRLCDDFERLGAINRSKWVSTNHGKWEGMAIAYEQAALKCRRAAIASEAGK